MAREKETIKIDIIVEDGKARRALGNIQKAAANLNKTILALTTSVQNFNRVWTSSGAASMQAATAMAGAVRNTTTSVNALNTTTRRAATQMGAFNTSVQHTSRNVRNFGVHSKQLGSVLATLTKAVVSMVGVLIAFNLLITAPERLMQALIAAFMAGIRAVANFEQRVVELQAILASLFKFEKDPIANFIESGKIAIAVTEQLIARNVESIASLEDTSLAFQVLVASGVGRYVESVQEAVDLSILLSNAVAAVTVGQDRSRQISEEIRALMQGTLRSTSLLVKLLFESRTEYEKFRDEVQTTKGLLDEMRTRLIGFVQAIGPMSMTMESIKTSFTDIGTQFSRLAFSRVFKQMTEFSRGVADSIGNMPEQFRAAAAAVGAGLETLFNFILERFKLTRINAKNLFELIEEKMPKIVGWLAAMVVRVENFIALLKVLLLVVSPLVRILTIILFNFDNIMKIVSALGGMLSDVFKGLSGLFTGNFAAMDAAAESIANRSEQLVGATIEGAKDLAGLVVEIAQAVVALGELPDPKVAGAKAEKDFWIFFEQTLKRINELMAEQVDLRSKLFDVTAAGIDIDRMMREAEALIRLSSAELTAFRNAERLQRARGEGFDVPRVPLVTGGMQGQVQPIVEPDVSRVALEERLRQLGASYSNFVSLQAQAIEQLGEDAEAVAEYNQKLEELKSQIDRVRDAMIDLQARALERVRVSMEDIFGALLTNIGVKMGEVLERGKFQGVVQLFRDIRSSIRELFSDLEMLTKLFSSLGNALANFFERLMSGGKPFEGMREAIGDFVIMVGKMLVQLGTALVALGIFATAFGFGIKDVIGGLKLIGIGAAIIAAGVAIRGRGGATAGATAGVGGGGGAGGGENRPAPIFVQQSDVAVQQNIANSLSAQANALTVLGTEVSRLSTEDPGVVVKRGIDRNPRVVTNSLSRFASRNFQSSRTLGGALLGET